MPETETTIETPEATAPVTEAPVVDAGEARPEGGWSDEYVQSLRSENAERRTKYKPFEDTFKDYKDEEVATFLEVAKALKTDPIAAADWFEEVAKAIKGDPTASPEAKEAVADARADASGADDPDRPMTRAEYDAIRREEEKANDQQKSLKKINKEITDLGYEPESASGIQLQYIAVHQTGGDLKAAHEVILAERQKIIDDYVETLRQQGGAPGATPGTQGFAPSGERKITNLDQAAAAMKERLKAAGMA